MCCALPPPADPRVGPTPTLQVVELGEDNKRLKDELAAAQARGAQLQEGNRDVIQANIR